MDSGSYAAAPEALCTRMFIKKGIITILDVVPDLRFLGYIKTPKMIWLGYRRLHSSVISPCHTDTLTVQGHTESKSGGKHGDPHTHTDTDTVRYSAHPHQFQYSVIIHHFSHKYFHRSSSVFILHLYLIIP